MKYKKNFGMFYIGWLLDTLINIVLPVLLGILVDEMVYYQDTPSFYRISTIVLITVMFMCVLYFLIYAQHQYLMSMYTYDIRKDIFDHWQHMEPQLINDSSSGEVLTLLQSYAPECFYFVIRNIVHFVNGIIKLLILVIMLFIIDWRIGFFILIAAPFSVYVNVTFGKKGNKFGKRLQTICVSYNGWLYEIIEAIYNIRFLGAKKKVQDEFKHRNNEIYNVNMKSGISQMTSNNIINLISLIIRLTIYTLVGILTIYNNMTIGTLLVIVSYYSLLTEQVWWTSNSYIDSQRRVAYVESIRDFLNAQVETDPFKEHVLTVTRGDIIINHISFSYRNAPPLFNDLSLHIESGKRTAIVGHSGCGKSTLAYLLLSFYKPTSGTILIDNENINEYSIDSVRSNIGLISQDVLIFGTTIRENILLGNKSATEEDIIEACKKAEIWDFINSLPQKLDTVIGPDGQNLSGGQKQRIAIARIYVKNPPIIIFDEATSSVDDETEASIHDAWKKALLDRTAIIIAHKLSSVMLCDNIAVIENGAVVSYGKSDDIIQQSEKFREIFSLTGEN